jgi:hypothetical protein
MCFVLGRERLPVAPTYQSRDKDAAPTIIHLSLIEPFPVKVTPVLPRQENGWTALGSVYIHAMTACKWRVSALPLLTYEKYAPLRFSKSTIFGSPRPEYQQTLA